MIIEFYLKDGRSFMREMGLPLPNTYRIIKPNNPIIEMLHDNKPIDMSENYIEFKLGTIRYGYHPLSNVVGLPRKAYKEVKK
jgi:hypothetical protein